MITDLIAFLTGTALKVNATARNCLGRQTIAMNAATVYGLTPPAGAVAAVIQADGAAISLTLDGVTVPTVTIGSRIDDGIFYYVDTPLANVKMMSRSGNTNVQVAYFDKA